MARRQRQMCIRDRYSFRNNVLVWEDSSPQPTDSDLKERMRKFDSDQGLT